MVEETVVDASSQSRCDVLSAQVRGPWAVKKGGRGPGLGPPHFERRCLENLMFGLKLERWK